MDDKAQVAAQGFKLVTVWSLFGFASWADAAQFATALSGFLAAILSFLFIVDWFWKRIWKPLFTHFGWFGFKRRNLTMEEAARISEGEQL